MKTRKVENFNEGGLPKIISEAGLDSFGAKKLTTMPFENKEKKGVIEYMALTKSGNLYVWKRFIPDNYKKDIKFTIHMKAKIKVKYGNEIKSTSFL